jgi:nicotinate-nucleotide pyrophosphorylase (carboxylating)
VSALDPPLPAVRRAVDRALEEDLGALGDITAGLLPTESRLTAHIVTRDEGVLAGSLCATQAFLRLDPGVRVDWGYEDGAELAPCTVVARVEGPTASVLTAERTALNFLCHLSGVATMTRRFVRAAHGKATILDTRKTTPGLRALEKAAVRAGGGANHRSSLADAVLLKDNHLIGLGIADAVTRARSLWPGRTVEVECDGMEQVRQAVAARASVVMLDNMTPEMVRQCIEEIDGRAGVEVSGGVDLHNVGSYAEIPGVEFISVGSITHSAPALDIALDIGAGFEG